jgi:hypothetical protein
MKESYKEGVSDSILALSLAGDIAPTTRPETRVRRELKNDQDLVCHVRIGHSIFENALAGSKRYWLEYPEPSKGI